MVQCIPWRFSRLGSAFTRLFLLQPACQHTLAQPWLLSWQSWPLPIGSPKKQSSGLTKWFETGMEHASLTGPQAFALIRWSTLHWSILFSIVAVQGPQPMQLSCWLYSWAFLLMEWWRNIFSKTHWSYVLDAHFLSLIFRFWFHSRLWSWL